MVGVIIVLLIIFWFLGYIQIPGLTIPNISFFVFNGHPITLWNIAILALILWAIGILPSPLQEIGAIILLLWILSTLGFIAIGGLSSILVIAVIVGLIATLFGI